MSKEHRFWNNEPVDVGAGNEFIRNKGAGIKKITLPDTYRWDELTDTAELSGFLLENYVEDSTEQFRLHYSKQFLDWMTTNPRNKSKYNLLVRRNNEIVGFAFAKEHVLVIRGLEQRVVSVNFLCIKKSLRGHRLDPLIIREITRRANTENVYQAIFTGGIDLFFNVCSTRYFHRQINSEKLFKLGFSSSIVKRETKRARSGTRLMTIHDIPAVMEIYNAECAKYDLYEIFDENMFAHDFLYKENIVYTYVHERNGCIEEFGSFFVLDSVTTGEMQKIRTAYLYYRSSQNVTSMVEDLIYFAEMENCDVFNCINIMGNDEFISELGFEPGSGSLKYYLYNWKTEAIDPSKMFFLLH